MTQASTNEITPRPPASSLKERRQRKQKASIAESKGDRFKRLATARMARAILHIGALAPLSNPAIYEYDRGQVAKLTSDLHAAVDRLEQAFKLGKPAVMQQYQF